MNSVPQTRRSLLTWLVMGLLFGLCGVLGFLQYRWIGEVSVAARDRLRASLQSSLSHLSQDFDAQVSQTCDLFLPADSPSNAAAVEREVAQRYRDAGGHRPGLLRQVCLAEPHGQTVALRTLNWQTGGFDDAPWPAEWQRARHRFESILPPPPRPDREFGGEPGMSRGGGPPPPPPPRQRPQPAPGVAGVFDTFSFETPVFGREEPEFSAGPGHPFDDAPGRPFNNGPGRTHEIAWVIFQLDAQNVRETVLPNLIRRDLNSSNEPSEADYEVTVVTQPPNSEVIYESEPGKSQSIRTAADASTPLFEAPRNPIRPIPEGRGPRDRGPEDRPPGNPGPPPDGRRGDGRKGGPGRGPQPEQARWIMTARHRAGSLEAAVARTRRANLAVTGVVLLLMVAAVGALIRFTRRAQHLAHLQMDFVAGVSHELRTPLTVIHTAAYNLQGRLSNDSKQVEKYGALIQKESARLKSLVEQILRFARAGAGHAIESSRPVAVETVIEEALQNNRELIESGGCTMERSIARGLPKIAGDAEALEQVVSNLIGNAIKYGTPANGGAASWIGITAAMSGSEAIEIRVADRGPGIPRAELDHVFEPFFRGARARDAQIRGTGLGLTLVKKIVEAHSGTISVRSDGVLGTEFIVRLPVATGPVPPRQDEPPLRESGIDQGAAN